jgi:hypothetical protein
MVGVNACTHTHYQIRQNVFAIEFSSNYDCIYIEIWYVNLITSECYNKIIRETALKFYNKVNLFYAECCQYSIFNDA